MKGKMVVPAVQLGAPACSVRKLLLRWSPPEMGWTKLNTDGSFIAPTGAAGGGMILHDDRGEIIYIACREIRNCDSALEVELAACREGIYLDLHRTDLPIIDELDSAEAVAMLTVTTTDRSRHRSLIEEIRRLVDLDAREI